MITQQHECYAAEAQLERGRLFDSVAEAQRFVDGLRDERWWTGQGYHLAVARIEVGAVGRGKNRSVGWYEKDHDAGRIELTSHGFCVKTVLHEVAHVLAAAQHGSQSHDPWWARTFLTLVSCVMGPAAYLTLQRALDEQDVDYHVTVTPSHVIAL